MSSALPCGTPSTTSTRRMSPSSFSPARSASVPPICPAPISAILLRAMPIPFVWGGGAQSRADLRLQMLVEERHGVLPQLRRGTLAIARPVIGEEGVPGVLVDLDRHVLAGALRAAAQLLGLRDGRVLILLAEECEERAMQAVDHVEDRRRALRRRLGIRCRAMDETAPAIDRRIGLAAAAREQQGLPATRAEADDADLAGRAGKPAQMIGRCLEILNRLGIRLAKHNREDGIDVVRIGWPALAGIEVGSYRVVSDIGKAPGDVADVLDEPEGFMDDDDAGIAPGLARLGEIALYRVAPALQFDVFAAHAAGIGHRTRYIRHATLLGIGIRS